MQSRALVVAAEGPLGVSVLDSLHDAGHLHPKVGAMLS